MDPADVDSGARIYRRGVGGEEEEEKREVNHGVGVVSRVITCPPPMRCARLRTIDHDGTTPTLKDDKATLSRLHQWGTSEARTHLF